MAGMWRDCGTGATFQRRGPVGSVGPGWWVWRVAIGGESLRGRSGGVEMQRGDVVKAGCRGG